MTGLRTRNTLWARIKRDKFLLLMLLLPVAYYFLFHYQPMYGVVIAFKKYSVRKGIMGSDWVGLKHFSKFLSEPYFWQLAQNTLILSFYDLLFGFPAPILLALLLNELRGDKFRRVVQSTLYLPHFISTVVVCSMVANFLSLNGFLNRLLSGITGQSVQFLNEPRYFRTIFVASGIWQGMGWGSIIYLAALTGINPELYEAATMDGANRLAKMRFVTLPCIAPTISIMLILAVGRMLSVNTEKVLLLYRNATLSVADVISTYVYRRGIQSSDFSYATAVGMFQSVIGMFLLLGANGLTRALGNESLF